MNRSRTQKATFNIATSAVLEIIRLISMMILPRLVLTHYGSAYNGIASSASQFLSLISVLTMGVTASTRVALYKTLAKNDVMGTSAIVRATEKYMRRVGLILGVYVFGLASIYPLLVHTGFTYLDVAALILVVGINSFSEYYFGITYRTLLLADQSVYISNIISCVTSVLSMILSIVMIRSGCSYQLVKLAGAMMHISRLVFQNIYVRRHYRIDRQAKPDLTAIKGRGDAMMHALANIIHDHTDVVVLTIFTDVRTVSVYTVYNLVMGALKKLQLVFSTGTEPIFGSMWAKGEYRKIKQTLDAYEYAVAVFCSIVFSTAITMLLPFVTIYTRGVTDVNYIRPSYGIVIALAFAVQCFRVPYLCVVQGVGHYRQTKRAAITEAALNLSLSVILVNLIGMVGVAIGTLAANLYRTIHYACYIDNHITKRGKKVFASRMLWALMNIAVTSIPAYQYANAQHIDGWLNWCTFAMCVFLINIIVVVLSSLIFFRKDFFGLCRMGVRLARKTLHK